MKLLDFVARYNGQFLTAPGGIGGQCVDLSNQYLIDVLSDQPVRANAIDWRLASIVGMRWVANTPTNAPPAGALVVWKEYAPHGIGQYGHIALALVSDTNHLITFDQDWPIGSPCALTLHDYGGVLGWHAPDWLAAP